MSIEILNPGTLNTITFQKAFPMITISATKHTIRLNVKATEYLGVKAKMTIHFMLRNDQLWISQPVKDDTTGFAVWNNAWLPS